MSKVKPMPVQTIFLRKENINPKPTIMNMPYAKVIKSGTNYPSDAKEGSLKKKPNMKQAITCMTRVNTPKIIAFLRIP